ncbi:MAG: SpoIID/LytB domain-containing protein [Gaiellaceae bacterium MAG52_C11]|nr:SpoIID/LytB domain-containing protein [Candidatus Gaiellasilicea maunaloa]
MRRPLLALIGSVSGCAALVLAAQADAGVRAVSPAPVAATTFLVSGRGWGHGVGMSQYGALGFANAGRAHAQILGHFYPGTTLGPAPVARVRVLLAESKPVLTVSSKAPFRIRDVLGTTYTVPAGPLELRPKLEPLLNGVPTPLAGPIVVLPGRAPLELGTPFRGRLAVTVAGSRLSAINLVGLEDYLAGVVPREMPAAWPVEALKAQAIAARSYALAHRVSGRAFDLYADVRSQVYGGIASEDARATAAIKGTAGRILLHEGKVVDALFHSTSGGRTVSAAEVFGTAVPYLAAVVDPYSSLSPVDRWGPTAVTDSTVRRGLGIASSVLGLQLARSASGRVRSATVTTSAGPRTVTAAALRAGLGLRSTWITTLGSLTLTRPAGPVVYGRTVTVRADAKGVGSTVLAQRVGGIWTQVAARATAGAIQFTTKLLAPTSFRLSAGAVAGPVLAMPVAPLVKLSPAAGGLEGTVTPASPGTAVQLELLEGDDWVPAGVAVLDDLGAFRIDPELAPGTYRARVAPAAGFAEGLSSQLRIG